MSSRAEPDQDAWPAGRQGLDGTWELIAGDHDITELRGLDGVPIEVPGLWEAQGHLGLDGVAWYRRSVDVEDPAGWWTLHVGAVMDDAEVYLNGRVIGSHRGGFTPFDLDCQGLAAGANEIAIRVTDHPAGSAAHLRSAHGKQGWNNDAFPSPPSLYLTYGGIWQSVWLERHGPARIADAWVNGDPEDLVVEVTVTAAEADGELTVAAEVLGERAELPVPAGGGPVTFRLGKVDAPAVVAGLSGAARCPDPGVRRGPAVRNADRAVRAAHGTAGAVGLRAERRAVPDGQRAGSGVLRPDPLRRAVARRGGGRGQGGAGDGLQYAPAAHQGVRPGLPGRLRRAGHARPLRHPGRRAHRPRRARAGWPAYRAVRHRRHGAGAA